MWDLIVSIPDHCESFYFVQVSPHFIVSHLFLLPLGAGRDVATIFDSDTPWRCFHCFVPSAPLKRQMSPVRRKAVYAICEQQRRRSACASAQSAQRLCLFAV